jgi:hypothetical protein
MGEQPRSNERYFNFARNLDLGCGRRGACCQAGVEGTKRRIGCCQAHSNQREGASWFKALNGCNCRWGVTLARGQDGMWTLFSARNVHIHQLCSSSEAALAGQRLLRGDVLAELESLGDMLLTAGILAAQINHVLQINAQRQRCLLRGRTMMCTIASIRQPRSCI